MRIRCSEDEILDGIKIEDERVRIDSIKKKYKACEVFQSQNINSPFMLAKENIPEKMIIIMLSLMPVFVVKKSNDSYACVGNLRVLQLARITLTRSYRIKVKIIDENERVIRHMTLIELIVMPMLHSNNFSEKIIRKLINVYSEGDNGNESNNTPARKITRNTIAWPKLLKSIISTDEIQCELSKTQAAEKINASNCTIRLTKNCARLLVEMYPIFVVKQDKNKYRCLANKETFEIVKAITGDNVEIPVIEIKNNKFKSYEITGEYIKAITFSICKGGAPKFGKIVRMLRKEDKSFIFKGTVTQKDISQWLEYSSKYIFHMKPKRHAVTGIETKTEKMSKYDMDITNEEEVK